MKKIIFIPTIFISMCLFFSCKENTNQEKEEVTQDTASTEVIEDTVATEPEVVEVKKEEQLAFAKGIDMSSVSFGYISNEKLYLSTKGGKKWEFPDENAIINFTFNGDGGNDIVYIIEKGGSAKLRLALITEDSTKIELLTGFEGGSSSFKSFTYSEPADIVYYDDKVYFSRNFDMAMAGFSRTDLYLIEEAKLEENVGNSSVVKSIDYMKQTQIKSDSISDRMKELNVDGNRDFYFVGVDSVRLSNTEEFNLSDEDVAEDEYAEPKSFGIPYLSPSKDRFFFDLTTGFGDLAHGPQYLVDTAGTKQIKLNDDGVSKLVGPLWLDDFQLLYKSYDKLNICKKDFTVETVAENVTYYQRKEEY